MASEYKLHKPYVLASLPRPLNHTNGRIVSRQVYGLRNGSLKKRPELAVGIDGETASIYDVPGSRLITSYPIPPQESFTCPPYSVRVRRSGSDEILRYTFIATKDHTSHKLTLFKDEIHPNGKTTSSSAAQSLKSSPIKYIALASAAQQTSAIGDLIAVCQNGEIICLTGDQLVVQWNVSAKSVIQDFSTVVGIDNFEVVYATSASRSELVQGLYKHRPEVFTALPKSLDTDSTLIVMLSQSLSGGQLTNHLITFAASSGNAAELQRITPLDVVPLPSIDNQDNSAITYNVDAQAGLLLQLQQGKMSVYELTGAVPKLKSTVQLEGSDSFVRLSKPFVLACSPTSIALYNHQYRSVHATAALDLSDLPAENHGAQSCQLIAYLRKQDLVVALVENVLVSIQVEPPKNHGIKRKSGLLIDSIGRGAAVELPPKKSKLGRANVEFSNHVPGTMTENYLAQLTTDITAADHLLSGRSVAEWEELLRQKFDMKIQEDGDKENSEFTEWDWSSGLQGYPNVDRRWILYAISQVFSVEATGADDPQPQLRLLLPDTNVTMFLVLAGHLTLSNVKSAFREDLVGDKTGDKRLASNVISCLTEADPTMALLLQYLQATKLGEVEVLLAIRALMLSMDLIPRTAKDKKPKLLKNEAHQEGDDVDMDLDDLEQELAVTELYLGDDSSSRSRGLTLAFFKLWKLPASNTVKALRTALQTEEILSLIHLLRIELVQGAWTSLYIDPTSFDSEGNEPPPDGVIALVSDLLGRCLDAVGAGGWLLNDAMYGLDSPDNGDFVTALKLEVTAALEGIEEAVYLHGLVGEAARYGAMAQKATLRPQNSTTTIMEGRESRVLPLGLKTKQIPTKDKVVSGGEVVQRSSRETGYLISQKVEAYSLERLTI